MVLNFQGPSLAIVPPTPDFWWNIHFNILNLSLPAAPLGHFLRLPSGSHWEPLYCYSISIFLKIQGHNSMCFTNSNHTSLSNFSISCCVDVVSSSSLISLVSDDTWGSKFSTLAISSLTFASLPERIQRNQYNIISYGSRIKGAVCDFCSSSITRQNCKNNLIPEHFPQSAITEKSSPCTNTHTTGWFKTKQCLKAPWYLQPYTLHLYIIASKM